MYTNLWRLNFIHFMNFVMINLKIIKPQSFKFFYKALQIELIRWNQITVY